MIFMAGEMTNEKTREGKRERTWSVGEQNADTETATIASVIIVLCAD